jgi:hypothetical protein
MPNVEFAIVVEEGLVNVRLDYIREGVSILVFLFRHALLNLIEWGQLYGVSTISVLSRLNDPYFIGLPCILVTK